MDYRGLAYGVLRAIGMALAAHLLGLERCELVTPPHN